MNSLDKITSLYRALSEVNQAIVRLEDEDLLFPLVCDVCVAYGGMSLAWIGRPDSETNLFHDLVSRGTTDYLCDLAISCSADIPEGNGPAGLCWRQQTPIVINDFESSEILGPWKDRARKFGIRSNAAFPVMRNGKAFAVLGVYHVDPDAFDQEVIRLLDELARDISFALDNFDRQRAIEYAQGTLLTRERHFRAYFENSMVGMMAITSSGNWLEANQRFLDMVGYSLDEVTSKKWDSITHPDDRAEIASMFSSLVNGESDFASLDARFVHKNGSIVYGHITYGAVHDEAGEFQYVVTTVENITERVLEGAKLELFGRTLDGSLNEIYIFDAQTLRFTWVNSGARRNLGYALEELLGMTAVSIKPNFTVRSFLEFVEPLVFGDVSQLIFNTDHRRKDGSTYPVEVRLQFSSSESGNVFVAVILDITERQNTEASLTKAASLFNRSREGIVILDSDNRVSAVNQALTALLGYSEQELIGLSANVLFDRVVIGRSFDEAWSMFTDETIKELDLQSVKKNGTAFINHVSMTEIGNDVGETIGYAAFCRDVTLERLNEHRILRATHTDTLTELMNREAFTLAVHGILEHPMNHNSEYSVILLNLDNFKALNEFHGYVFGDKALIEIAQRLRSFEIEGLAVCRVGGDEFALALNCGDGVVCLRIAQKALDLIFAPIDIDGHNFRLSASVGIAMHPRDAGDLESIFRLAGSALSRSKQEGRNRARLFDATLNERYSRTLLMQDSLRSAVEQNQFYLVYQPLVSLIDGKAFGCEALLRWLHPELGFVSPYETIRIAEETGFILELGEWVLDTAICQLAKWRSEGLYFKKLALNISAFQFLHGRLVETLSAVLRKHDIPASLIDLEITESVAIDNLNDVKGQIERLKSLGVSISIDDFGTGYSSLSYLRKFQASNLKIDRSFVMDICEDREVRAIVEAIIGIAKVLGVEVIAEGVETVDQLEMLRDLGCEYIQGFLVSQPLSPGDLKPFISRFELEGFLASSDASRLK